MYTQHRYGYYSTASRNKQHKIAVFATRVVLAGKPPCLPPWGKVARRPDEGAGFRAANHKRAAETSLTLISQRAGPLTASVFAPRAACGGCTPTRACGRSPSGEAAPPGLFILLHTPSPRRSQRQQPPPVCPTNFFTIPSSSGKMQLGIVPCSTAATASSRSNHFT